MAETHVLSALIKRRAELAGEIEGLQITLRQRIIDLSNLDATVRLFDPEINLEEIKPKPMPPRHSAFRGEVTRIVLGALRDAKQPLTSHELAQHVMAERGLNTADKRLVRLVGKRVGACLRHHRAHGLVQSKPGDGQLLLWECAK